MSRDVRHNVERKQNCLHATVKEELRLQIARPSVDSLAGGFTSGLLGPFTYLISKVCRLFIVFFIIQEQQHVTAFFIICAWENICTVLGYESHVNKSWLQFLKYLKDSDISRARVTQKAFLATPVLLAGGQTVRNLLKYLKKREKNHIDWESPCSNPKWRHMIVIITTEVCFLKLNKWVHILLWWKIRKMVVF